MEGFECDPVSDVGLSPGYTNNTVFFRMNGMCSWGGDSGGPLYTTPDKKARGLIMGGANDPDCSGTEYVDGTHIQWALNALNVNIAYIP